MSQIVKRYWDKIFLGDILGVLFKKTDVLSFYLFEGTNFWGFLGGFIEKIRIEFEMTRNSTKKKCISVHEELRAISGSKRETVAAGKPKTLSCISQP